MRRIISIYLILSIFLIASCTSTVHMIQPPNSKVDNKEYYRFVEWQRDLNYAQKMAGTFDVGAVLSLVGALGTSSANQEAALLISTIGGGFYAISLHYYNKYNQLIEKGRMQGWVE